MLAKTSVEFFCQLGVLFVPGMLVIFTFEALRDSTRALCMLGKSSAAGMRGKTGVVLGA